MKKKLLPYAGVPVLLTVYLILNAGSASVFLLTRDALLLTFGYIAAWSDWKTRKVSNKLFLLMLAGWAVTLSVYVVIDISAAVTLLLPSIIGGTAAGGLFVVLYLVSRKGIGGADVKFIAVAGLYLTLSGVMPVLFLGSLLAALTSVMLLITKRATMKTAIPLLPFLYIGIILTVFL